ncbi:MAG: cold shock domain-containing protein [Pseudomonadota bacterium]
MRMQGNLVKWQDDRGFGFIRTRDSGVEIFVHVSEFPRGGRRPQIGDPLSFEIRTGEDGRKQARAVTFDVAAPRAEFSGHAPSASRPYDRRPGGARRRARSAHDRPSSFRLSSALILGALIAAAAFGWNRIADYRAAAADAIRGVSATAPAPVAAPAMPAAPPASVDTSRCEGRTHCSQMRSCTDATWVLRNCPNTAMDGDGDGIPCEQQWCG